jgi:hypothetical protein
MDKCFDCLYFAKVFDFLYEPYQIGYCRRHAPVVDISQMGSNKHLNPKSNLPEVNASFWCGDFKNKETNK